MPKASKKSMAFVLVLLLLITSIPIHLLANETPSEADESSTQTIGDIVQDNTTTSPAALDTVPEGMEIITYNLGTREINVGYEGNENAQAFFDADGNFEIKLEDNAFFPYEVQFKWDENVSEEWFETPDDTVEINGHEFTVYTEQNDPNRFSQLGFWLNGEYTAAKPTSKEFMPFPPRTRSLIKLETIEVEADLTLEDGYASAFKFSDLELDAVLNGLTSNEDIGEGAKAVWIKNPSSRDGEHEILTRADSFDVSAKLDTYIGNYTQSIYHSETQSNETVNYSDSFELELVVGSAAQLDSENIRYIVTLYIKVQPIIQSLDVYTEDGSGARVAADFANEYNYNDYSLDYSHFQRGFPSNQTEEELFLGLTLNPNYNGYTVKAVKGDYADERDPLAAALANDASLDIASKVLRQTMTDAGTGLPITFDPEDGWFYEYMTLIFYDGTDILGFHNVQIDIYKTGTGVRFSHLKNDSSDYEYSYRSSTDRQSGVVTYSAETNIKTNTNGTLFALFNYEVNGTAVSNPANYVTMAVVGHAHDTPEAANVAGATDIKAELFGAGYRADYTGDGQDFTVFADGKANKYTVKITGAPPEFYALYKDGNRVDFGDEDEGDEGVITVTAEVASPDSANDEMNAIFEYNDQNGSRVTDLNGYVDMAVLGHYNTVADANAAGAADISNQLFYTGGSMSSSGYPAVYGGAGQKFTVFVKGTAFKYIVQAVDVQAEEVVAEGPQPAERDTYMTMEGAVGLDYDEVYILPYQHDTAYDIGYQTVFYIDEEGDMDLSALKPEFMIRDDRVRVYAGHDGSAGDLQISEETERNFSGKTATQYSVAAGEQWVKNYWVTFVPQVKNQAKLFVNGINGLDGAVREVFLTSIHDNLHDIFIANVGDQPLEDINVTLSSDAQNIKLDDYWTVGGDGNDTLAGFTTTSKKTGDGSYDEYYYDELNNVAKIRLLPDLAEGKVIGDISGTLTITAKDQEPVVITLTGKAGDPQLTTEDVNNPSAVKYVPFAKLLMHDNKYYWNEPTLTMEPGTLAGGISLKKNGELYGVPQEFGEFEFTVEMDNSDSRFRDSERTYVLKVLENTDPNVFNATDANYDVELYIGGSNGTNGETITEYVNRDFQSEGAFSEFQKKFYFNGKLMNEGTDYTASEGSTKITIMAQTFNANARTSEVNTIAAEFREDNLEDHELRRAAQNFRVKLPSSNISTDDDDDNNSSGRRDDDDRPRRTSKPPTPSRPASTPAPTSTPTTPAPSPTPVEPTPVPVPEVPPAEYEIIPTPVDVTLHVDTETAVEDGTATVNVTTQTISDALAEISSNTEMSASPIVIEIVPSDLATDVTNVNSIIPMPIISELANVNAASVKINMGNLGIITLPNDALKQIAISGGEELSITLNRINGEAVITLAANSISLNGINTGYHVALPGLADREVLVIMRSNGVEEIIKKSVFIDGVVYAELTGSGTLRVINNSKMFSDVNPADPFNNAILFVNSRELFMGISETEFAPNATMTRAMLATVLHRFEDNVNTGMFTVFSDVPAGEWYSAGISWAAQTGIVSGYGDGSFGLNDNITKEQLIVFMYRYANAIGMKTVERGNMSVYTDMAQTSSWAIDAMRWAAGVGLLQNSASLDPQGEASRALVADTLMKFMNVMLK